MDPATWLRAFLSARQLARPDGRPLCTYRCREEEFATMASILGNAVRLMGHHLTRSMGDVFCLYAAEWWRRNHTGGPWKWEGILDSVGFDDLQLQRLYPVLEKSLRLWWQRPILRDGRGRIFLVTLACEGGLPLALIHREGASLRNYFRSLLEEFRLFGASGVSPEELAARASRHLPSSLRQDVVFQISGQLVAAIWKLQEQVGDSSQPVATLDRLQPDWRERLPMEIGDATPRALLNSLVEEASRISREAPARIRLVRRLRRVGAGGWELEAELELPKRLTDSQLGELLSASAGTVPGTCELFLENASGNRSLVAMVTRVVSPDPHAVYRVEVLPRAHISDRHAKALEGRNLYVGFGTVTLGPIDFTGSRSPGTLPWVFLEENEGSVYRLATEGSVHTRRPTVVIAVPVGTTIGPEDAIVRRLSGPVEGVSRALFEVSGVAELVDPEGHRCVVRTAQSTESTEDFRLRGKTVPLGPAGQELFVGMPEFVQLPSEGQGRPQVLSPALLEWRPRGSISTWQAVNDSCCGEIELRHVRNGELRFRAAAAVLPVYFRLELRAAQVARGGTATLSGLAGALVGHHPDDRVTVEYRDRQRESVTLDLTASGDPPATFPLELRWGSNRKLSLEIPFPIRRAVFLGRQGEVLRVDETVPLDRLAGVRASALSLDDKETFHLDGSLIATGLDRAFRATLWEELTSTSVGRRELDLRAIQEPLRQFFAESADLDAMFRLRVESANGEPLRPRSIYVGRFDFTLILDRESGEIVVETNGKAIPAGDGGLHLEAIRLWEPGADPEPLAPTGDPRRWRFDPDFREPGPWLLLGWDGDWCRVRPTLWTIPARGAEQDTGLGELQRAVCLGDPDERSKAFGAVLEALNSNPLHHEWDLVRQYLGLLNNLPASALELPVHLARNNRSAVNALLQSSTDLGEFARIWNVFRELPFSWDLVPARTWRRCLSDWHAAFLAALSGVEGATELANGMAARFLDGIDTLSPEHKPITEWLRGEVMKTPLADLPLAQGLDRAGRQRILKLLEAERQELFRRTERNVWPPGKSWLTWAHARAPDLKAEVRGLLDIGRFPGWRHPTLMIPIAAALAVVYDLPTRHEQLYELRRARRFDQRWFEVGFEYTLRIALGVALSTEPESLR